MAKTASEKMLTLMFVSRELLSRNGKEVPMWFFGNPGCAKSETVKLFAEIMGYECLDLEANSRTEEDIKGFMSTPSQINEGDVFSAAIIKPDWLDQIEKNAKAGKKTLIFIDEINTLSPQVAAVLLQLIQKRSSRNIELGRDVLIVAAGNYFENIENKQMTPMVTMLNRFCLINLTTEIEDLELSDYRYEDILSGTSDEIKSYKEVYLKKFANIIERFTDPNRDADIASREKDSKLLMALFNKQLNIQIKRLVNDSKKLDFNEKRIANLYTESPLTNGEIYNLLTLRTKDFLVELTGSFYRCFGMEGLTSANYSSIYEDLVKGVAGFGAIYDSTLRDVKFTEIWKEILAAKIEAVDKFKSLCADSIIGGFIKAIVNAIENPARVNHSVKPFYKKGDLNDFITAAQNLIKTTEEVVQPIMLNQIKAFSNYLIASIPKKTKKQNITNDDIEFFNECSKSIKLMKAILSDNRYKYNSADMDTFSTDLTKKIGAWEDRLTVERDMALDTNPSLIEIDYLSKSL